MAEGFIVVAVLRPEARQDIRAAQRKFQRHERLDFLFAAQIQPRHRRRRVRMSVGARGGVARETPARTAAGFGASV